MPRKPRLTTPLIRADGVLRPASWREALATAANGLASIRDTHGGSALGFFSCSKATNETNYLAQKFVRVALHSNNVDSCNRT